MAYVSIAGLAMLCFLGAMGCGGRRAALRGIDLRWCLRPCSFCRAWPSCAGSYSPAGAAGRASRLYVVSVLGQVFLQLTGLLGLFDTWLDCRKSFRLKSPAQGS
jgi:hypothetical protein